MANIPTYSSKNVKTSWAGYTLDGLAPDSFIEFQLNSDLTDEEVGADGSVSISISPDETGTFTLRLQQNSPGNNYLSGVLNSQRLAGTIVSAPFTVRDPSGLVANIGDAHIKTAPTIVRGNTATGQTMEWVFFCQKLWFQTVQDDNSSTADLLADAAAAVDLASEYFL